MTLRWTTAGPTVDDERYAARGLRFIDSVLRGLSQVMLQDNRWTGLLFLLGIFWNSALFGTAALLGCAISTLTAIAMGAKPAAVRTGVYGFNGALVGIALLYFLQPDGLTWACVIFAATCSTVAMTAMTTLLARWQLPAFTAPFVLVSWGFFLATARFGRLHATALLPAAGLPASTQVEGVVGLATVGGGLFNGIAQVFFQENVVTGVLFALGLLVASRRAALVALAGSITGLLIAWGMGAAEPAIHAGAFGFNGVLVGIALAGTSGAAGWRAAGLVAFALVATPFVYAALSAALQPLGIPALTFPFVLVTWWFLAAAPRPGSAASG